MSVTSESAATAAPYVILKEPDGSQRKHILSGATAWTLGRDEDNAIVLSDPSVSRQHALLQYLDNNSIYLIDLGSRNGSFVNNRRVSIPTLLQDGDRLTLGQSQLEFHSGSPASSEPSAAAKPSDTLVLQTRWLISVAVVDVRGYGQLTQQLDERLLSQVMGDWFRRGGDIIQQHGGTVDKYIGDAIMAVWFHVPQANTTPLGVEAPGIHLDVKSVLQAIAKLFQMTEQLNGEFPLPSPIRLGAGVNTGSAIVRQVGNNTRQEYTALGDTVNLAFRIESATRTLNADLAISQDTYTCLAKQLGQAATCFSHQAVELKGYAHRHQVYYCDVRSLQAVLSL
ncbi:MAG TPA: adenylate/guanylate cyclase domain-containing protein [Synechococcus sp. M44_DOE_062]|nr:adenylate/guanylate cyclase domain-containing protein [Synechococcus sp. M44_DOE_062]